MNLSILHLSSVRNLFSGINRHVKRNVLWTFFIVIFFLCGISVGKAWANTPERSNGSVTHYYPKRVYVSTSQEQALKIERGTSTTTTTTTSKPQPKPVENVAPVTSTIQGDWVTQCHIWAGQAGIDLPGAAIILLARESHCNPLALNPSSKAGGIPQALPYTKMGCPLSNDDASAVCQLKWMHGYVFGRYGGWEQALAHSNSVGWY